MGGPRRMHWREPRPPLLRVLRERSGVLQEEGARTVYQMEMEGRCIYCTSVTCVSGLLKLGWKLSDPQQLSTLVRALACGFHHSTHEPSDHFR